MRPTAVILAADPILPAASSVEFYQDVVRFIDATKAWIRLPHDVITSQFQQAGYQNTLGSIPRMSAETLKNIKLTNKKSVIPQIQMLLDSLAIPAAIIVSCEDYQRNRVKSCSLFYYDRNRQRIFASVVKKFTIPVYNATRWASVMVKTLASGIETAERKQDQETFDHLLAKSEEDKTTRFLLNFSLLSEQSAGKSSTWNNLPQLFVAGQYINGGQAFGVEGSYGHRAGTIENESANLRAQSLGLSLNYSSPALESLIWDFGIGLGFSERKISLGDTAHRKTNSSVYLALRPGLYCQATKAISMGLSAQFKSYITASSSESERLKNYQFGHFSQGLAIGLRIEF